MALFLTRRRMTNVRILTSPHLALLFFLFSSVRSSFRQFWLIKKVFAKKSRSPYTLLCSPTPTDLPPPPPPIINTERKRGIKTGGSAHNTPLFSNFGSTALEKAGGVEKKKEIRACEILYRFDRIPPSPLSSASPKIPEFAVCGIFFLPPPPSPFSSLAFPPRGQA